MTSKNSKLKAVDPKTAEPKKPKILIYGKPGVGKTWVSLDFPGVYYIDSEGGANLDHYTDKLKKSGGAYMGTEQGALDFEEVISQIQGLATEEHLYKTVVIDSISKLFNTAVAVEAERLDNAGKKNEFGIDKKPATANMRRLVNWLSRIDMNVILIAHEKPEWGLNANKERVEIGSTFDGWDKLSYELDIVLNVMKQGNSRKARVTKSRLKQFEDGNNFDWSYEDFSKLYGKEIIEKKSLQIKLADGDQLTEMKHLLGVVKLPEGQEEKWLSAAQVSGWEEMSYDRISDAIIYIKKTYLNQKQGE